MESLMKFLSIIFFSVAIVGTSFAQKKTWKNITESKEESWFASEEAQKAAENVLLYQREIGGWPKNIQMQNEISDVEKQQLIALKLDPKGCTTDNGATCQEMIFLSKMYKQKPDEKYKNAFLNGLAYLLEAQYENGGWPQFFPLKKGYYTHITYNDDSMAHILKILKEIKDNANYNSILIPREIQEKAVIAFDKGINCILKTQYKRNGELTSWCAQHDEETLLPAKARAYELPSLSGKESAKIVLLLMSIEKPTPQIVASIEAAVKWFEKTKISGIKIEDDPNSLGDKKNKIVVQDSNAEPLWARFMELDNDMPFFCDRDGVKKATLAEIGSERGNGYTWYTNEPKEVLKKYQKWIQKRK
jgi:pectinesterase